MGNMFFYLQGAYHIAAKIGNKHSSRVDMRPNRLEELAVKLPLRHSQQYQGRECRVEEEVEFEDYG